MQTLATVKRNLYYDSVTLMRLSSQISELCGVTGVLVGMGTELNKELLANMGLHTAETQEAGANDLVVAVRADDEQAIADALAEIDAALTRKERKSADAPQLKTIGQAAALHTGYNLAVVSVPGIYAARECAAALHRGMHVFLFSDNVELEQEVALKQLAAEKNLLLMGPDCGTAIINGVPLGFANRVRRGNIGIAAASGTGLQQVTTLIDRLGGGISQAVGVGGRDLSERVGGLTMLAALDALGRDAKTEVVVVLSKPPAPSVAEKVMAKVRALGKPAVFCLFGQEESGEAAGIHRCSDMEETAVKAVSLALGRQAVFEDRFFSGNRVAAFAGSRKPGQKYLRGVFGGGTLCDEAMTVFRRKGIPYAFNTVTAPGAGPAGGHTFIDMGDDAFTKGKPHPMIEPALRNERIVQDARMPDTAVMLIDIVLGHGCHADPAGLAVKAARDADRRDILWIASLVGADGDPQDLHKQAETLLQAGFVVTESNARAATLAAEVVLG